MNLFHLLQLAVALMFVVLVPVGCLVSVVYALVMLRRVVVATGTSFPRPEQVLALESKWINAGSILVGALTLLIIDGTWIIPSVLDTFGVHR